MPPGACGQAWAETTVRYPAPPGTRGPASAAQRSVVVAVVAGALLVVVKVPAAAPGSGIPELWWLTIFQSSPSQR